MPLMLCSFIGTIYSNFKVSAGRACISVHADMHYIRDIVDTYNYNYNSRIELKSHDTTSQVIIHVIFRVKLADLKTL